MLGVINCRLVVSLRLRGLLCPIMSVAPLVVPKEPKMTFGHPCDGTPRQGGPDTTAPTTTTWKKDDAIVQSVNV